MPSPQDIDSLIEEFEHKFCNNHQKPVRFLRSIFYDEQDGAEQIESFIRHVYAAALRWGAENIPDTCECCGDKSDLGFILLSKADLIDPEDPPHVSTAEAKSKLMSEWKKE